MNLGFSIVVLLLFVLIDSWLRHVVFEIVADDVDEEEDDDDDEEIEDGEDVDPIDFIIFGGTSHLSKVIQNKKKMNKLGYSF